jgi:hypothetical protein
VVLTELTGQLEHEFSATAPVNAEYLPAAQSAHAAGPGSVLYFPAAHAAHVPPFGPVCPRAQRQAETTVCPVADVTEFAGQVEHELSAAAPVDAEYLPAAQSRHVAVPVTILYFPATHAVHATPLGPEYPVLQTQLSTLVLAVGEFVNEGHA